MHASWTNEHKQNANRTAGVRSPRPSTGVRSGRRTARCSARSCPTATPRPSTRTPAGLKCPLPCLRTPPPRPDLAPKAQLAPTEPRAQPEPLEGWPWPQYLASGRPKVRLSSFLSTTRHALSFPIWWLVAFTIKHNCWHWPTWRVVRDIIKPMTAMTRCRFAELPEFRDIVGAAQARRRPLSPLLPPPPCNAHHRFRPPHRSRSDRTAGAPSGGCSWRRSRTGPTPTAGSGSTCAAR